jgi:hypothetical protein
MHNIIKKKASLMIAMTALLVFGIFGVQANTQPAHAHSLSATERQVTLPLAAPSPPCSGPTCFKLDPFQEGCGTATSYNALSYTTAPLYQNFNSGPTIGYIYNYYSTWCNANWAEAWLYTSGGITISIDTDFGEPNYEFQCYPGNNNCPGFYYGQTGYPTWTNMVNGTDYAYACANLSIWAHSQVQCVRQ